MYTVTKLSTEIVEGKIKLINTYSKPFHIAMHE